MKYSNSFLTCLAFFLLFLILSTLFLFDLMKFLNTPLISKNNTMDYILPSGASVRVLANDLNKLGVLDHPVYFELLAYAKGYAKHLHAGEYRFVGGETPEKILKKIADGKVLWRQITFIEGWNFNQILYVLENSPLIVHDLAGLPDMMIMMKLNIPGIKPEGLFFPETYKYTAGMSDKAILLQAYQLQQKHLKEEWENREPNLPYKDSYEALIAASIIEKEAHVNSERAEIAGVIVRRLEKNMLLQMDPTVMYGLGDNFHPPLRKEDLKIDSPYNTYLYAGLPPTPICSPSLASLHAALHPNLDNDALYFVAKGNGTHQFSATYQEHKKAIQQFEH